MAEQKFVTVVKAETVFKRALITQEQFDQIQKYNKLEDYETYTDAVMDIKYEDWECEGWEDNGIIEHEVLQWVAFKGDVMCRASEEVFDAGLDCWNDEFPKKALKSRVSQ